MPKLVRVLATLKENVVRVYALPLMVEFADELATLKQNAARVHALPLVVKLVGDLVRALASPLLRVPVIDCSSALTNAVTGQHDLASRTREMISGFGYVT